MIDTYPVYITQVELSQRVPDIVAEGYSRALVLVRLWSKPLGLVQVSLPIDSASLFAEIKRAFGETIARIYRQPVATFFSPDAGNRLYLEKPEYVQHREEFLTNAPPASIIICTRDRPPEQVAETLDSLLMLDYPDYEIIIVDNFPSTDSIYQLIKQQYNRPEVKYVREDRPGLSWARNCGLKNASNPIIVYTDDDAVVDRYWLANLAMKFNEYPDVGCVTGMTLPREIETQAHVWFEQFGGLTKGRGFEMGVFNTSTHASQDPLFPAPAFGAGVNMAFASEALNKIGGFDTALGAGTPTKGGEDTAAYYDILVAGYTLVYEPAALVFHSHRRTYEALQKQLEGYGFAVTAFYMHCLFRNPFVLLKLIGMIPTAFKYMVLPESKRTATMNHTYPAELDRKQFIGMLKGPAAYLKSRKRARQIGQQKLPNA
jgi:glycosyltransferase involved in cell wall biosynthesis